MRLAEKQSLVVECIEHYSKKGEVVLNPFSGSSVTLAEAIRWKRAAIAIDLNPIATFITKITVKLIRAED